jgi:PAS domain S-box-containing protein
VADPQAGKKESARQLRETIAELQAELAHVQSRTRLMIGMSSDMVFISDLGGKFQFANPAAAALVDKRAEDLAGKTFGDLFPRDIAQHLCKRIRQVFDKGEPVTDVPPFLLPPKNLWVECRLLPIHQPSGKVESAFIMIRDITEQKLVERALKESEERFRQIVEQMPVPVLVMVPDGTIVMANSAFLETVKNPPSDTIIGKVNVLKEPIVKGLGVVNDMHKAFSGTVVQLPELSLPLGQLVSGPGIKKEDVIVIDATVFPVYLRPGEVFQVVAIFRDITERKHAELALLESDKKARTQYKSFPVPTYTWQRIGDDFVFVDYNDAANEFTSGGVSSVLGKKLSEVYSDQPFVQEDMVGCWKEKSVIRKRLTFRFPVSKVEKQLMITYVFVEPDLVMVHTEDVTEKEKMETEIRKAEHLESLGVLAGGIAHDFNNLLAGIFGYIGLARELGKHDEKVKDCLDNAMTVFGQAKSLTQQLLTFSKGGSPVRKLASIAELLRDNAAFVLSGTNVKPDLILPADLWACEVDTGQLSEVINNCVINAQQAMPEGGVVTIGAENVTVDEHMGLSLTPGRYVRIYIRDTGVGIPKQHLARVFDPFFTTKQKGSGLGLTIAYSVVQKHLGHLEISSEPGAGTLVRIYLPASTGCAECAPPEDSKAIPMGHGSILIMDDEMFVLDALAGVITSLGYSVETAADGHEALRRFSDAKAAGRGFDAVILDLTIPGGFGGKQVLSEILKVDPAVKAVATSGYSDDPVMSGPQEFGFKAALRKPFVIDELAQMLQSVIKAPRT